MAKNDKFEDLLDDISVLKGNVEGVNTRLDAIELALKALSQKVGSAQSPAIRSIEELKHSIQYDAWKDAVGEGMANYYATHPAHSGLLSRDNAKKLAEICGKVYADTSKASFINYAAQVSEKNEMMEERRAVQGLYNIQQVQEWAPEYSPEIQRAILCIGRQIIPLDECAEKAQRNLKVWGDALSRITAPPAPVTPSFRAWCLFKRQQVRAYFKNRRHLACLLIYVFMLLSLIFLSLYQCAVMDLDRTNRIFYKNVMMNARRSKDYHDLDSLIHANSFFQTFRTLDE